MRPDRKVGHRPKPGAALLRPKQLQMGSAQGEAGICVGGPETHQPGAVVSVPGVARNSARRFKLQLQVPQPAKVDFFDSQCLNSHTREQIPQ